MRLIGQGGFGDVYEVIDGAGNRFAQKVFHINQPNFSAELADNVKKRFIREAEVQAAISHPNIMPVLSKNLEADPPSYVMPLALSTLEADIQQDKNLNGHALQAIMDILSGLEELHSMDISHRDLKPQNVLKIVGSDGVSRYVISDFGLISLQATQVSVLTQTGMMMGSDWYTAPEIVGDLRRASARSDIYSVGCILHDFFGTAARVPCNEINETGFYGDIFSACTRRDPARRFESIGDLREAILSLGTIGSIASTPPQVADYISMLNGTASLDRPTWERIVRFIDKHHPSTDTFTLLKNLSQAKLAEIINNYPDIAYRLASAYTKWVREGSFDFDTCDGIANRLELFNGINDLGVKSDVLIALLIMGTTHNRWYVERKFFTQCDSSMDQNLAKRLSVEFRVMKGAVCRAIAHLERSIGVNRSALHPVLISTLAQVC
ncbi:serine/threonine-protein kinase [Methylovorus sp. SPW-M1]